MRPSNPPILKKSPIAKFTFRARNLRSRAVFSAIRQYACGNVLDIGGRDFYLLIRKMGLPIQSWTVLEHDRENILEVDQEGYAVVLGDGCNIPYSADHFDTVLNIQVLEHVLEPNQMVAEMARVLKPGGYGIFLIPQTAVLHELPSHYYNFTRFWIKEIMARNGLVIIELHPLGGVWSSMASHLVYFFFQSIRAKGLSTEQCERNVWFYLLFPLMVLYALISIPVCLFLSLGDLTEEPNNHLVVVQKETARRK